MKHKPPPVYDTNQSEKLTANRSYVLRDDLILIVEAF